MQKINLFAENIVDKSHCPICLQYSVSVRIWKKNPVLGYKYCFEKIFYYKVFIKLADKLYNEAGISGNI